MSTLNQCKSGSDAKPPIWTHDIPECEYHAAAANGTAMSSGMLKEFRNCPAHYHALIQGRAEKCYRDSYRVGRAAHKLLLEGEAAFAAAFAVGGPLNERTGRSFGAGTKAFEEWLSENGLDRRAVLTPSEAGDLRRMQAAARSHPEIALLFASGWPERTARAPLAGVECQCRLDWLRGDGVIADLKTVEDIDRFEADARRFGYLNQFAFYRDVARAAGGGDLEMTAVVLEKKAPYRAGMWRFSADILEPYAAQNRQALDALRRCRETGRWPTGYEKPRAFPLAGIPPLWLN